MIGSKQIIVNCFGNTHDPALIADLLHISAYFIAGIHGIVSAVIEKVPYIVFFEYLEYSLVVSIINFGIRNLISA